MKDMHDLRVSARTWELFASDGDEDDGPPWRFSGVAVAAGDIAHTADGKPVLFTEEELRAAAETQSDEPLTVDHPADDRGRPQYPPPTNETVGKVRKAGWLESVNGVGYDATTHDEEIAAGVKSGSFDVSVHPKFTLGEKDPETGAYIAKNIQFLDLSVVSKGDAKSNTAEWGPNQALASYTRATDIGEELAAAENADDGDTRSLVKKLAERVGLIDSNDFRGGVRLPDQTTDGETAKVGDAGFDDAPWLVTLHASGEEYADIGEGLGPELGVSDPYDAGDYEPGVAVTLDEALEDDQTLFALLRYHVDGEVSDPIPTSDGGYYLDSAFVGVAPDGVMDDSDEATASAGNEGAESSVDDDLTSMDDNTRQQYVTFLTANAGFDEESVTAMDDGVLEQTYELAAEATDSDGGDGGSTTDDDDDDPGKTVSEMTVGELGSALREQGFVTEDDADEFVEQATAQASKSEKVEEIIAKADDYDEDDREELMASSEKLVEREHQRVRGELAAAMPSNAGQAASLTAGASSDTVDEYGTGVKED